MTDRDGPRVAVVLPGGGARGAYEVGALAELLPALEARGETVSIYCGTSMGAINATMLASQADRGPAEQAEAALTQWREMRKGDVIQPIVGPGLAATAIRAVGDALDLPGLSLTSVLDPAPLRRSVERWVDWQALRANVRQGKVEAVCVVATSLDRGGPVAFVETRGKLPAHGVGDDVRFERVSLTGDHVRASAAIPMLFPPVEVTTPRAVRGHYIDGGTRLNLPRSSRRWRSGRTASWWSASSRSGAASARAARRTGLAWPRSRRTWSTDCSWTRSPTTCTECSRSTRSSPSTRGREPRRRPARTGARAASRRIAGSHTRWSRPSGEARSRGSPRRCSSDASAAYAACARPTTRCWPASSAAAGAAAASCCRSCSSTPTSPKS